MQVTLLIFLFLSLMLLPQGTQASPPFDPNRLEATELVSGVIRPMELAVALDGRVFYIELDGNLKVYDPESRQTKLLAKLDVTTEQENGLIGLALDPNFAVTQHIFLQYSPPNYSGQHISRFTLAGDQLDMQSEKLLLKFEEQRKECCHHSGSLEFGPHGCLFIGTGDNTHPGGDSQGYAPIDERPDHAPYDAQKSASNTHHLGGKILRIRPLPDGTYAIPDGNLFPADGSAGCPEIYVMGCRNPWRINVDQRTGFLYWGEVGPDARNPGDRGPRGYDEVNQARQAGNFGWPYFIADNQAYADVDFATGFIGARYDAMKPINASPNNTGSRELPPAKAAFVYYPYDASEKFPELGTGGRTACAGPVYHFDEQLLSDRKFPRHFDNTLFIYEWSRHWIKCVHLDADSQIKSIEAFMPNGNFRRPIDIEFGPDGAMYLIEYGETWGVNEDAKIVRIDYVGGNRRPHAVAQASNNVGREPLVVTFSSEGTLDKDQHDNLQYEWACIATTDNESNRVVISTEANPTVTFEYPGVYNVELTVRDREGASATASVPVLVGNAKADIRILQPQAGFFEPGQPIRFDIVVNDPEDGTNDLEIADEQDLPEIDGESATRVSVNARLSERLFSSDQQVAQPRGLQLMKGSDCFNCHDLHAKRVGPPLIEISKKYRDDGHALAKSVERVIRGSTGVWGKIPMIAHNQHTATEVHTMVQWIYSLKDQAGLQVVRGFVGDLTTDANYSGGIEVTASYEDLGRGDVPSLTSSAALKLRSRQVEAEHASKIQGLQSMNDDSARNRTFLGAISHGAYVRFDEIATQQVDRITARVATGGGGGTIEFRVDGRDGPMIGQLAIRAGDDWTEWWDETVSITPTPGIHDLYLVFMNEERREGLLNLDSLYFHPTEQESTL